MQRKKTLTCRILSNNFVVGVGLVSYSAYLWHQPLFALTRQRMLVDLSMPIMGALCVITFILAFISWRYIEKPFRSKGVIGTKKVFRLSVLLSVSFIGVAVGGYNGLIPTLQDDGEIKREASRVSVTKERQIAIRAGICHFNNKGVHSKLSDFLSNWQCSPNDENLPDSGLLIFGDSHSADKTVALAQNGVDVVQITGASCPIAPQEITKKKEHCQSLLSLAERQGSIKKVVLSNRFKIEDLNRDYLINIFAYWSSRYNEVILFSPMPNFKHAVNSYIKFNYSNTRPSTGEHDFFYQLLDTINIPDNVTIIDTHEVLCGKSGDECSVVEKNNWLLTDYGHLSVKGAKLFGERLKASEHGHIFFSQKELDSHHLIK